MKLILSLFILFFILPGFAQEEDEELKKLENQRKAQQELVSKLTASSKKEEVSADVPEEVRKLGYKSVGLHSFMDERVVKIYQNLLKQNPLVNAPIDDVKKLILEKSSDSILGPVLADNPRLLTCLAEILKDKTAISDALGIFLRKGDLKLYFVIWLLFMIQGWLIKRIVIQDDWSRSKRNIIGLSVTLLMTAGSLTTFYKIFEKELSATSNIIVKNWNS